MSQEQWYYASQGRQLGPVTRETLRHLIVNAQVREDDLVWTPGMSQWAAAQMVPQLMTAPRPMQQGYPDRAEYQLELAGFAARLAAWLIDMVVLAVVGALASLLVLLTLDASPGGGVRAAAIAERRWPMIESALVATILLIHWLYYALMESSPYKATLGKLAVGIFVTGETGEDVTFLQASARFAAKSLSALILMIGFLMVAWSPARQGLHDMIARTLVVRRK